jgi:hypothetical protein
VAGKTRSLNTRFDPDGAAKMAQSPELGEKMIYDHLKSVKQIC